MAQCQRPANRERKRVVLTGGPGAGKTALLELVRRAFCEQVLVLPESAGILFGGGFPREPDPVSRRAAQRAIFHVQRELETIGDSREPVMVLCDRGTIDGLAYWPGPPEEFWSSVGTTLQAELARYDAVIHLRTPAATDGYNHQNPLRIESAETAAVIDARIELAWAAHPRRFLVPSWPDFLDKASRTLSLLRSELPDCCHQHGVTSLDGLLARHA